MSEIPRVSLTDTLHLIELARETALSQGAQEQASRLMPVVNEIQNLVTKSQNTSVTASKNSGVFAQDDFRQLLEVAQTKNESQAMSNTQSYIERNQMILSMAAADMTDLEIARQMEMTTEEVNLVLSMNERGYSGKEII